MAYENNNFRDDCGNGVDGCRTEITVDENGNTVLTCAPGGNSCSVAPLLELDESGFHDSVLQNATQSVNEILNNIPPNADGKNLSFVTTKAGVFLAWVHHGGTHNESAITAEDDKETVVKAFNIKQ
jgi:hypothetical protein